MTPNHQVHAANGETGGTLAPPRSFTIALSREAGTRGTAIAREVGRRLGWQVYDQKLLQRIAKEMGLREPLLQSIDERHQSWWQETVGASLASLVTGDGPPWASETSYVHHLIKTVAALGAHGECVIVGCGAACILPAETTLRVHLVGPVSERITTLSRERGISVKDAAQRVRTLDRDRYDFVVDHFYKVPTDPRNFDLVLNAVRLSVTESADLIVETLRRFEAHRIEAHRMEAHGMEAHGMEAHRVEAA